MTAGTMTRRTGNVDLMTGDVLEIHPLLPEGTWSRWRLDGVRYHGHDVGVAWEAGKGGFTVTIDGKKVHEAPHLGRVEIPLSR